MNKKLIVICGPTAAGKTRAGIELAGRLETEIISADSRQLYREMNLGTAKPSPQELDLATHHFIDSHSIHQPLDAGTYGREACALLEKLFQKKNYLIAVGGSGLYIKALTEGFDEMPEVSETLRSELRTDYEKRGLVWLQKCVCAEDPDYFSQTDISNPHRLLRALEIIRAGGKPVSHWRKGKKKESPYDVILLGLNLEREELYRQIDRRTEEMVKAGLMEEAAALYPFRRLAPLQTVGYSECFDFLEHKITKEEAVRLIKRNTRRYAKRQLTWFAKQKIKWFTPNHPKEIFNFVHG
ncbi:MAG: tRNA (adenosine(37)-N6)-dimethylallyltransferase MiaA [Candidatus Nephrothrix sp. EaCA]|nr:MAG: tRNA (adenosine(37)-N6)-dimethylallyltransferase MiaA [Candidatus Nephrothrix sp. EaCA]